MPSIQSSLSVENQTVKPTPDEKPSLSPRSNESKPSSLVKQDDTRHTEYIKLVGLPFTCNEKDVLEFLAGFTMHGEAKGCVHFTKDRYGRAAGKAIVRLACESEAKRAALQKHKSTIGWRYIEVYHIGEREVSWYSLPLLSHEEQKKTANNNNNQQQSFIQLNNIYTHHREQTPPLILNAVDLLKAAENIAPLNMNWKSPNNGIGPKHKSFNPASQKPLWPPAQHANLKTYAPFHPKPVVENTGPVGYDQSTVHKALFPAGVFVHNPYSLST